MTDAIDDGARARCGAELPQGPGFFYPPTVLTDVPAGSRIAREEIFGPVLAISTFDTEEQAVAASNDTEEGKALNRRVSVNVLVSKALDGM